MWCIRWSIDGQKDTGIYCGSDGLRKRYALRADAHRECVNLNAMSALQELPYHYRVERMGTRKVFSPRMEG